MKLFPVTKPKCDCEADITVETTMLAERRGEWNGLLGVAAKVVWTIRRAKRVFHYRKRDQAHFWHWSDQQVVKI